MVQWGWSLHPSEYVWAIYQRHASWLCCKWFQRQGTIPHLVKRVVDAGRRPKPNWNERTKRCWRVRQVGSSPGAVSYRPVSSTRHFKPYVRFSRIRLSDNLHPSAFMGNNIMNWHSLVRHRNSDLSITPFNSHLAKRYSLRWSCRDLSMGVIGYDPVISCTVTYLLARHSWSRGPSLLTGFVVLPVISTMASSDSSWSVPSNFGIRSLYLQLRGMWALDFMRSLLFRHLLSQHSASSTPESSSGLRFQILHPFCGLRQHLKGSALSCSPSSRGNLTMLQSSLYVTDCCFAPPSQRDTSLQHNQSPGSTGRLLLGSLAITETGLAPVSKWQLSGRTKFGLEQQILILFQGSI